MITLRNLVQPACNLSGHGVCRSQVELATVDKVFDAAPLVITQRLVGWHMGDHLGQGTPRLGGAFCKRARLFRRDHRSFPAYDGGLVAYGCCGSSGCGCLRSLRRCLLGLSGLSAIGLLLEFAGSFGDVLVDLLELLGVVGLQGFLHLASHLLERALTHGTRLAQVVHRTVGVHLLRFQVDRPLAVDLLAKERVVCGSAFCCETVSVGLAVLLLRGELHVVASVDGRGLACIQTHLVARSRVNRPQVGRLRRGCTKLLRVVLRCARLTDAHVLVDALLQRGRLGLQVKQGIRVYQTTLPVEHAVECMRATRSAQRWIATCNGPQQVIRGRQPAMTI